MDNKRLILGLDVSTTTIGIALMLVDGDNKELIKITSITPKIDKNIKGIESLFIKKQLFEDEFLTKYVGVGITDVVIEEPLLGSNNVNTVATLLRFNGMISESIYRMLGIVPVYISSYDSRKYGIPSLMAKRIFNKKGEMLPKSKVDKADSVLFGAYPHDIDKKRIVFEYINELFPNIEWPLNKKGELLKTCYDTSDAICCVLGFINREKIEEDHQ